MTTVLTALLMITSILMIVLVLLHKGRGGGLSDMFGGGLGAAILHNRGWLPVADAFFRSKVDTTARAVRQGALDLRLSFASKTPPEPV